MTGALINGVAGAGGGLIAQLLTYPLQAVNTRQQTEGKLQLPGGEHSGTLQKSRQLAPGTLPSLYQVIREEGWGGLYRGLRPSLVGTAASQGVYYYFYQIFRTAAELNALENKELGIGDGSVGMFSSLAVAALAGCFNVLMTNPIWVIVTRMQTQRQVDKKPELLEGTSRSKVPSPHGAGRTIRELYAEAGPLGFWKGVLPTLLMVSNPSIQFMIYESLLKHITAKRNGVKRSIKDVSAAEVFVLGALSKLGATVVTYPFLVVKYPFLVVKSRLQAKQEIESLKYTGTLDAIVKMLQLEGVRGFYKGMSTKILQSVVAAAILFMVKEQLVKLAHSSKPRLKAR